LEEKDGEDTIFGQTKIRMETERKKSEESDELWGLAFKAAELSLIKAGDLKKENEKL